METIFKGEQINLISNHLGITKVVVGRILTEYIEYLKEEIRQGKTVKFLNVCYLKVDGKDDDAYKTLAYIAHDIGDRIGQTQNVVHRVLITYEDFMIRELRKLNSYSVRGLVRIKLEKNYKGEFKVRTKKSTVYNNDNIYITTLGSFKRRVEVVA